MFRAFPITTMLAASLLLANPALAAKDFRSWVQEFKVEAYDDGISAATVAALDNVQYKERVIELDQSQPESKMTFDEYLSKTVNQTRVERGRTKMAEYATLLRRTEQRFGVPPRFIVALWGKETDYGRVTGGFNVLDALATLAYDGRRAEYFRGELLQALRIIDAGHVTAENMKGSWAGAMGQCQFMPTSFFKYAVDGDGDGRADIWNNEADVFASAANYLRREGWNPDLTWGRQVRLTSPIAESAVGVGVQLTLPEWAQYGITNPDGSSLPDRALNASLVQPDGASGRSYLVYDNFRVLMHWNRSTYFATAVGTLADRIGH